MTQERITARDEHYLRSRRTNGQASIDSDILAHRDLWRHGPSELFRWLVDLRLHVADGIHLRALYKVCV